MKILALTLTVLMFTVSCGYDDDSGSSAPKPSSTQIDEAKFQAVVAPVVQKSCGGGKCHTSGTARDAIISSGAKLVASRSNILVASNKMPKPGSKQAEEFSAEDKQIILGFIAKYKK